jgi:hypothetical protein
MSGLNDTNWKGNVVNVSNANNGPDVWIAPKPSEIPGLSDIWKASNVENLTSHDLDIPSSDEEDSVDAVRGSNYKWLSCIIRGSVTLKGAIKTFLFQNCTINGTMELGQFDNYWYWGRPPTTGGKIDNCFSQNGTGEIKCILWDADEPEVVNSRVTFVKRSKFIWIPYFISQYIWVRLVNLFLPAEKKHATS